jgi:hypothetical protein
MQQVACRPLDIKRTQGAAGPCPGRGSLLARWPDRPQDIKRTRRQPGRALGEVLSLPGGQIGRRTSKERRGSRAVRWTRIFACQVARSAAGHQKNAAARRRIAQLEVLYAAGGASRRKMHKERAGWRRWCGPLAHHFGTPCFRFPGKSRQGSPGRAQPASPLAGAGQIQVLKSMRQCQWATGSGVPVMIGYQNHSDAPTATR